MTSESSEKLKVKVSRDHIRKAMPHSSRLCAVRQGIMDVKTWEMKSGDSITVRSHRIRIRRGKEVYTWEPALIQVHYEGKYSDPQPETLDKVITRFDDHEPIHPFWFILDFAQATKGEVEEISPTRHKNLAKAREISKEFSRLGIRSGIRKADFRPSPTLPAEKAS